MLLAYHLTPNKPKDKLDRGGMLLPQSVFSHGQLYVGFSRCRDPDNFFVYADQSEFDHLKDILDSEKTYTRNIVFPEIIQTLR